MFLLKKLSEVSETCLLGQELEAADNQCAGLAGYHQSPMPNLWAGIFHHSPAVARSKSRVNGALPALYPAKECYLRRMLSRSVNAM
jgi:hypothetical protein